LAKPPPALELAEVWTRMALQLATEENPGPWRFEDRDMWRKCFRKVAYGDPGRDVTDGWVDDRTREMDELGLVQREKQGKHVVLCAPSKWEKTRRGLLPIPPINREAEAASDLLLRDEEGEPVDALPRKAWNDLLRLFMDEPSQSTIRRLTEDLEELGQVQRRPGDGFVQFHPSFVDTVKRWTELAQQEAEAGRPGHRLGSCDS